MVLNNLVTWAMYFCIGAYRLLFIYDRRIMEEIGMAEMFIMCERTCEGTWWDGGREGGCVGVEWVKLDIIKTTWSKSTLYLCFC